MTTKAQRRWVLAAIAAIGFALFAPLTTTVMNAVSQNLSGVALAGSELRAPS